MIYGCYYESGGKAKSDKLKMNSTAGEGKGGAQSDKDERRLRKFGCSRWLSKPSSESSKQTLAYPLA